MSFIGIAFFFVFGGNILLSWGLLPWKRLPKGPFAAPALLVASAVAALLDGMLGRFVLTPWGLESMAPFVFALCLVGAFAILRSVQGLIAGGSRAGFEDGLPRFSLVLYAAAMAASGSCASVWKLLAGGAAAALGYLAATVFLDAILERLSLESVPGPFKGVAIRLVSAGLIAMAFSGIDAAFFTRIAR